MTSRSSVVELYGAAFPAWIFAALAGLALTLVLREAFVLTGRSHNLPMPAVFYSSIAILAGIGIYVLWIGGFR